MAIRIIVGLGNEGAQYTNTYHNAGRIVADYFKDFVRKEGGAVQFFTPGGFMNTSGIAVAEKIKQTNIAPSEILIVHDDSDLLLGEYKLVNTGASAGHNGVTSILTNIGLNVWRLKIGIRDPHEKVRRKAGDFVLRKISLLKRLALKRVARQSWQAVSALLQEERV